MKISDFVKLTITIFLFGTSTSLKANCEAGGYFIHTKATYHKDSNIHFLKGGRDPKRVSSAFETMYTPLPAGKYKISNLLKCDSINIKVIKTDDEREPEKYSIEGCAEIDSSLKYFYQIDAAKKTIIIGKALAVKSNLEHNVSIIEKNIKSTLDKTTISADTIDPDFPNPEAKKIDRKDILNLPDYRFNHTQVGKSFIMSIALLEIQNLSKYYNLYDMPYAIKTPAEKIKMESAFSKMTASFPVIYFTKNEKTEFLGDGSWCSSKAVNDLMFNLFVIDKPSQPRTKLGDIYSYKITDAYDLNGDGEPDIITINDVVSYWLKDMNSLLVIESQYGC